MLGPGLAGPGLTGKEIVGGDDERPVGQEAAVEPRQVEPLEVGEVVVARHTAQREHVGDVLGELQRPAPARGGRAAGEPVEDLAAAIAVGVGNVAVGEAARAQGHVDARAGERLAQRVVIRAG